MYLIELVLMPLKKIFMKKVILNREKVSQNDYLLIEEITSLPKSNTKKSNSYHPAMARK